MNTRGALNIGGMTDFNPDANVKLTRATEGQRKEEAKQK